MRVSRNASRDAARATKPTHHRQKGAPATAPYAQLRGIRQPRQGSIYSEDERLLGYFEVSLRAESKSQATLNHYLGAARQFMLFAKSHGMPHAQEIRREHLDLWMIALAEGDPLFHEPAFTPATRRNRFLGMRIFFKWMAERLELRDPTTGMKPPKVPQSRKDVVPAEDLMRVLDSLGKQKRWRDAALVGTFYDTGMRVSEVANLRFDQLNVRTGRVTLHGHKKEEEGEDQHTKSGRNRSVKLSPPTLHCIMQYRLKTTLKAEQYLFNNFNGRNGGALSRAGIYTIIRCIFEEHGIPHIGPHDLRHTAATHYRKAGFTDADMMEYFGWVDRKMLTNYSDEAAQDAAIDAYERLKLGSDNLHLRKRKDDTAQSA